jgi:hypothetical protein
VNIVAKKENKGKERKGRSKERHGRKEKADDSYIILVLFDGGDEKPEKRERHKKEHKERKEGGKYHRM